MLPGTGEQLMMARFKVWLTNQRRGVFHIRPHAEIEY